MNISAQDRDILRTVASEKAEIATLPINDEREAMWRKLNDLDQVRPMIQIYQIPWHEMNVDDELTLRCSGEAAKMIERALRQEIYQWKHMPGDMIVRPVIRSPYVVHDTGFGISEESDLITLEEGSTAPSRHFHIQIRDEEDLQKIKMPVITYDPDATEARYQALKDAFDGILEVKKQGIAGFWFAPWDELVRWWGVQEVLMDLAMRPEMVHKGIGRLVDAYLARLDQYVCQNLLAPNHFGTNATGELPGGDFDPSRVLPHNMWSVGAAQVFSEVSPEMHEEFAIDHEIRWYSRFGLNYYGCCEPLHKKVKVVGKIPNLRKISMSPWINLEEGASNIGTDYVFSRKPNPAVFAGNHWNLDNARNELTECLEVTQRHGCPVELIMKDISTVGHQPQRLWEWAEMAARLVEEPVHA
jgi:hypothetical protein